ncbi:MAG: energy transducer TonB [Candidatus Acidiferrales bacterium]
MRRNLSLVATIVMCVAGVIAAAHVFAAVQAPSTNPNAEAEEFIDKARDVVSLSAVGPVEIQADVKIAPLKGKTGLGTYKLDWAAPDRFRREIHFPGYNEVSVASGRTFYRKQSTDFTPLAIFRLEELMSPSETIAQFRRDEVSAAAAAGSPNTIPVPKPGNVGINANGLATAKETCITISASIYEELCTEPNGWLSKAFLRSTADDEIIEYGEYKQVGSGFVARERKYLEGGNVPEEVHVKSIVSITDFPANTFDPPTGAEKVDWCYDETPAQMLPLQGPLPVTADDFQDSEILDAFVNTDGLASHLTIIATGGPAADSGIRKLANLIRFTPAMCGGKPVASERPIIIGDMDIDMGMAEFPDEKVIPKTGEKGYAHPDCIRCPTPSYSDEGFRNRIQGSVVLTLVVMPDGRTRYVRVLKELGHGLDQAAVRAVLNW